MLDYAKLVIPTVALLGAIWLGSKYPDKYSLAVVSVLSAAVGGYYGATVPVKGGQDG